MNVYETKLEGVLIVDPSVYGDERGLFLEAFQVERYCKIGIEQPFVQDNFSRSRKGVLRGLHFQKQKPQGKLVSCLRGKVWDVAVDIDPRSPTYCDHVGIELSDTNHLQLWIPPGYAHGFCVLTESADFYYKCTDYYDLSDERGIVWSDHDLNIDWPIDHPIVSEKDRALPTIVAHEAADRS